MNVPDDAGRFKITVSAGDAMAALSRIYGSYLDKRACKQKSRNSFGNIAASTQCAQPPRLRPAEQAGKFDAAEERRASLI